MTNSFSVINELKMFVLVSRWILQNENYIVYSHFQAAHHKADFHYNDPIFYPLEIYFNFKQNCKVVIARKAKFTNKEGKNTLTKE